MGMDVWAYIEYRTLVFRQTQAAQLKQWEDRQKAHIGYQAAKARDEIEHNYQAAVERVEYLQRFDYHPVASEIVLDLLKQMRDVRRDMALMGSSQQLLDAFRQFGISMGAGCW